MTSSSLTRRLLAGAFVLSAVACSDSTAPVAPEHLPVQSEDVTEISANLEAVTGQPILDLLRGSGDVIYLRAARTSLDLARLVPSTKAAPAQVRASFDAQRAGVARQVVAGEQVVPAAVRGLTLAWGEHGWHVDTLANGTPRPGAPSNGVRVMLYALDEMGQPTGAALGHLEVVDNSTTTVARYTVRVVTTAGLTVLQFTSVASGTDETDGSFAQSGFVTDGTRRIEQSISLSPTGMRATWNAPFAGVSMGFVIEPAGFTGMSMRWSLTTPAGSVRFVVSQTANGGSARIYANGALWAQQSWTAEGEVSDMAWTKPDGSPIGEADVLALEETLMLMEGTMLGLDFDSGALDLIGMAVAD